MNLSETWWTRQPVKWEIPEPDPETVCSFCHQQKDKAEIIAGPKVHICLDCASLCTEIAAEREKEKREAAVKEMLKIEQSMPESYQAADLMYRLYDEGYRKEGGQ
jgi:ATP-dependent Clp protease ATP-binding subunit ClpX